MKKSNFVLLSGCSAGGIATYNWIQYLRDRIPSHIPVMGAPDSGLLLDYLKGD